MEIATKQELPDRIQWVKFSGAAWHGDGFFYSGYDKPAPGEELTAKNEYQKVFYHKLGDPQEKDTLVYEDKEHPLRYVGPGRHRGRDATLILSVSEGTSRHRALWSRTWPRRTRRSTCCSRASSTTPRRSTTSTASSSSTPTSTRPNFKVVPIDPERPGQGELDDGHPREARGPERGQHGRRDTVLQLPQGRQHEDLPAQARRDARPRDRAPGARDGRRLRRQAGRQDPLLHLHLVHLPADDLQVRPRPRARPRSSASPRSSSIPTTTRPSRSSTRARTGRKVPMFIVHKKGLALDGKNPRFLTAYGGFNISMQPGLQRRQHHPPRERRRLRRSPTCAAAASTARPGTRPACSRRSRTSSTTSSPRPST